MVDKYQNIDIIRKETFDDLPKDIPLEVKTRDFVKLFSNTIKVDPRFLAKLGTTDLRLMIERNDDTHYKIFQPVISCGTDGKDPSTGNVTFERIDLYFFETEESANVTGSQSSFLIANDKNSVKDTGRIKFMVRSNPLLQNWGLTGEILPLFRGPIIDPEVWYKGKFDDLRTLMTTMGVYGSVSGFTFRYYHSLKERVSLITDSRKIIMGSKSDLPMFTNTDTPFNIKPGQPVCIRDQVFAVKLSENYSIDNYFQNAEFTTQVDLAKSKLISGQTLIIPRYLLLQIILSSRGHQDSWFIPRQGLLPIGVYLNQNGQIPVRNGKPVANNLLGMNLDYKRSNKDERLYILTLEDPAQKGSFTIELPKENLIVKGNFNPFK